MDRWMDRGSTDGWTCDWSGKPYFLWTSRKVVDIFSWLFRFPLEEFLRHFMWKTRKKYLFFFCTKFRTFFFFQGVFFNFFRKKSWSLEISRKLLDIFFWLLRVVLKGCSKYFFGKNLKTYFLCKSFRTFCFAIFSIFWVSQLWWFGRFLEVRSGCFLEETLVLWISLILC